MSRHEDQKQFIDHINLMVDYWETNIPEMSSRQKLEGLAFSILTALDGCAMSLPSYAVIPIYDNDTMGTDIAGDLHENMHK